MFIQTETTPNPATLKFLPGLSVMDEGTADYQNADDAGNSPLAQRLFAVAGVRGVFLGRDFVTITKDEATDWDHANLPCLAQSWNISSLANRDSG